MEQYKRKFEEKVTELPYKGSFYIQGEDNTFVVYISSGGSKLPEFSKEFKTKREALHEFNQILVRASHGFDKL